MKKYLLFICVAAILFFRIDAFIHRSQKGFHPSKVTSFLTPILEWNLPNLENKEEISKILSQHFYYLDKGSQSYVFISHDEKHILKLLKQHKLKPNKFISYLFHSKISKKKEKFIDALESCKTAFLEFKEETGLIYLHLNNEKDLNCWVTCFDKDNHPHLISLDHTVFMLQKKADILSSSIDTLMAEGKENEAKTILSSLITTLKHFSEKGVYDNDAKLKRNFGVIDKTKVIQIDVGTFHIDPAKKIDICEHFDNSFKIWLETTYPSLSEHLTAELRLIKEI